jgi:hypothetical protein
VTLRDYIRKILIFWIFKNTISLNSNLSQIWWGRVLIHTFDLRIQILIMQNAYNPPGVPSRIFSQPLRPFSMVPIVQIWIKAPQTQKKSYIATIRDKWPYPVIGHPMKSTYQENCCGVMLTFMPSGRFTKTHAFCTEKWKLKFLWSKAWNPIWKSCL